MIRSRRLSTSSDGASGVTFASPEDIFGLEDSIKCEYYMRKGIQHAENNSDATQGESCNGLNRAVGAIISSGRGRRTGYWDHKQG